MNRPAHRRRDPAPSAHPQPAASRPKGGRRRYDRPTGAAPTGPACTGRISLGRVVTCPPPTFGRGCPHPATPGTALPQLTLGGAPTLRCRIVRVAPYEDAPPPCDAPHLGAPPSGSWGSSCDDTA